MTQRKKTEPDQDYSADLPDLNERQSKFVEAVLRGMNSTEAYRTAYDTDGMAPNTIWSAASRLRSDAKVSLWISAARKNGLGTASLTLDSHLQELERLKAIAIETGNVGAAVQAEQLRGKAAGHYVEKHQDVSNITDPVQTLREIAKESPELAASLASQHGIPWIADEGATKH